MRDSVLKVVLGELKACDLDASVVSFEPDDGAAMFDLVMSAVQVVTWKVDGYPDEVIRFIVNDENEIDTVMDALMDALLGELPAPEHGHDEDDECDEAKPCGVEWTLKRHVIAMYDEEPTLVETHSGSTDS